MSTETLLAVGHAVHYLVLLVVAGVVLVRLGVCAVSPQRRARRQRLRSLDAD